ncbi:MAG: RNA pyrophosphohydrolase [Alphaproteobacteria bacterium]|jgi:putative (di)nucleoside polyphosphate hydrolase|nr:RNA pyrophosphohydrolase [Alphaproteobacteria bacterium]
MEKLYRKGVGAVILNNNNEIFMAERLDVRGQWQMPQGGIEEGEDLDLAIHRELKEEIGTDNFKIINKTDWLRYELPENLQKNFWGGRYIGQEQVWFFLKFLGKDSDINLTADSHPEFAKWEWVKKEALLERITEFKKSVYQEIVSFAVKNNILK